MSAGWAAAWDLFRLPIEVIGTVGLVAGIRWWLSKRRGAREQAAIGRAVADITAYLAGYASRPARSPARVLVCSQAIWVAFQETAVPAAPAPHQWGLPHLDHLGRVPVVVDHGMTGARYALHDLRTYAARQRAAGRSDIPSTES